MPYQTILLLLLFINPTTIAQESESPPSSDNYGSPLPTNAIIIVVVVVSVSVLACYTRPFVACFRAYVFGGAVDGGGDTNEDGEVRRRNTAHGLDPKILATFPTFVYSDVKVHVVSKTTPLECAICLYEFVDHEHLRLLPRCSHVFHPHCIAPWFSGHVTCPVCRANLEIQVDDQSQNPHEPSLAPAQVVPGAELAIWVWGHLSPLKFSF